MRSSTLKTLTALAVCLCLEVIAAKTLSGLEDQAYMILGSQDSEKPLRRQTRALTSSITSMHVTSVVKSRFAKVTTVSEMRNTHDEAKEMIFSIRLPEAAFISNFTMVVDGVTFIGKVKEKAVAEEEYSNAKLSGNSAGLITVKVRETQTFNVAANVPSQSNVIFSLVYQELLKRKLSKYNHEIFVNPQQLVEDFVVNVYLTERAGITFLDAKPPHGGDKEKEKPGSGYNSEGIVPIDIDIRRSKYQAKITFKPSPTQMRRLLMIPENHRKMTVVYDVTRENLGGDLQTRNGYFVHYFAPESLPVLPKKIVFVIDRSGSMSGRKMEQTKNAFETVLRELSDNDQFNIVTFANDVTVWKKDPKLVDVTPENVNAAIAHVRNINAAGGTNLNGGILEGASLLKHVEQEDRVSSAIIQLTDGDPTSGVTNTDEIRNNVKKEINGRFSVFCIGFGRYLNYDFLKRLANENDGITRQIYEDSDATLQLEGFFEEVATPLLLRVRMTYSGSKVADVSRMNYDKYFGGSEVVVVGAKLDVDKPLESTIVATTQTGLVEFNVVSNEIGETYQHWYEDTGDFDDFIERIWAYYTIKKKLDEKVFAETDAEKKEIVNEVTRLALKYNFVTTYTSMVVVLPEDEVSTTSPISTERPPLPPCWRVGSPIPENIVRPIYCPYIVDDKDLKKLPIAGSVRSSGPNFAQLPGPALMAMPPPTLGKMISPSLMSNMLRPSYQLRIPSRSRVSFRTGPMYGYAHYPLPTRRPIPQRTEDCSGVLNSTSGTISMLKSHPSGNIVYCIWDIILPEGSWIDLHVMKYETTSNQIKIGINGKKLLKQSSGVHPEKYFYLAHNEINVQMKIYPKEKKNQGVVLSYQQYTPEEAPDIEPEVHMPISSSTTCGGNISSQVSSSGFITSPNYPSAYPSNSHCEWIFENTESEELRIEFVDMDIEENGNGECLHDKVMISSTGSERKFCGYQRGSFRSGEDVVTLHFFSDDNLESTGFKATYEFVPRSD